MADLNHHASIDNLTLALGKTDDETDVSLYYALYRLGQKEYFEKILKCIKHDFYRIRCAMANLVVDLVTPNNKSRILEVLTTDQLKVEDSTAAEEAITNSISMIEEGL